MRRTALAAALVASLVAATKIAALVAPTAVLVSIAASITLELALAAIAVAVLALKTLAARTAIIALILALVLALFLRRRRRALGGGSRGCRCVDWRALAGLAEIAVTVAPTVALALVGFCRFTALTCRCSDRLCAVLRRTAVVAGTVAIVSRPALFGAATGPPDFDQFGRCRCFGRNWRGSGVRRCGLRAGDRL